MQQSQELAHGKTEPKQEQSTGAFWNSKDRFYYFLD